MPNLEKKEIEELALLARLSLDATEVEHMRQELGAILEHFAELAAIDTEGVAPMTHAVPLELRLREDVVAPSLTAKEAVQGAPKRDGDLFLVPAIIT